MRKKITRETRLGFKKFIQRVTAAVLLAVTSVHGYGQQVKKIKIYLESSPSSYQLSKATLKYNKDFAFSFTLDDGRNDSYLTVFPFYTGGKVDENGVTYPGLFYTDGCGNDIPFKAGIAMTSVNSLGEDSHNDNTTNITWAQLKIMHDAGWDVFNHSYSHAAGEGTDYQFQISENYKYIKEKAGIETTHFVVPTGDANYVDPAFNFGVKAVYDQKGFPGINGFDVDETIQLNRFGLQRRFLDDKNYNTSNVTQHLDAVASSSVNGNHLWYNEFTHKVPFTSMQGSLSFATFEHYMNHIQNEYGKKGSDRVWMAPLQEVYEYLVVRDKAKMSYVLAGNVLEVTVDFTDVPYDLRRYAMSFVIDTDQKIVAVESNGTSFISFKGDGSTKLLNVEWDKHPSQILTGIISPFDTEEKCSPKSVYLYPNPTFEDPVHVVLEGDDSWTFNLHSSKGEVYSLQETPLNGDDEMVLDIGRFNLNPGTYYLEVISSREGCSRFLEFVKY